MAARKKKTARKASKAPRKTQAVKVKRAPAQLGALERKTLKLIESTADRVQKRILSRVLPELKFPTRSLSNVTYDRKVGYLELGKGRSLEEVVGNMQMVAEGVETTAAAAHLGRRLGVQMPIAEEVYAILHEGKPPRAAIEDLMARALVEE